MKDNLKGAGVWGQLHYDHLKTTKPSVIGVMRMNGNLIPYLQSVDEQANKMVFQLVKQLAKQEGVTEELKRRIPIRLFSRRSADYGKRINSTCK